MRFQAFNASEPSGYPRFPTALNPTSKRVRVNARRINNHPAHHVTIDTAADAPCVSVKSMQTHLTLKYTEILTVPSGAINLSSADGSPLNIFGYIQLHLIFGDFYLPVEALVLPSLASDILLFDNTIMCAFGELLDCCTEQLSLQISHTRITASHRRVDPNVHAENTVTAQCSVVSVGSDVEKSPVILTKVAASLLRVKWQ